MVTSTPVLLNSLLYAGVGMAVFVIGYVILDLLTPGKLFEEIMGKQNTAAAQFAGLMGVALAIIVAAAIHG